MKRMLTSYFDIHDTVEVTGTNEDNYHEFTGEVIKIIGNGVIEVKDKDGLVWKVKESNCHKVRE